MGGVNHQPCNRQGTKYLLLSTKMSRSVTAGIADFHNANVALEDVILVELGGGESPNDFSRALELLLSSVNHIGNAVHFLNDLETEMDSTHYQPLPAFANYGTPDKARALAAELASHGLMQFETVETIIIPQLGDGKGFYAAIPILRDEITMMQDAVQELFDRMSSAEDAAAIGNIADMLETNADLNFRADFLRAFNTLNRSFAIFAASAAWSTEMWYHSTSVGSLLTSGSDEHRQVG